MRHGFISAAAGTPGLRTADCAHNARQIISMRRTAIENNAKILLLPALCVTGAACGDAVFQYGLLDDALSALLEIRDACAGDDLLTFVGLPLPLDGKLYNCVAALHRGVILGIVPERAPGDTPQGASRRFAPCGVARAALNIEGSETPFGTELLFACPGVPPLAVGVAFSQYETQTLAAAGATLIVYPDARPSFTSRYAEERAAHLSQSAIYHTAALHAGAGPGESLGEGVLAGGGLVIECGRLLAEAPRFSAALAVSEIDLERVECERRLDHRYAPAAAPYLRVPFELNDRPTALTRVIPALPFVPEYAPDWAARCEETFLMTAHALSARLVREGAKRVVLGMTGSLGSTLAALTAANAMSLLERPMSDVQAVLMPGFSTGARASANAHQTGKLLGFSIREIDIRPSVTHNMEMIGHEARDGAVFENAQARERARILFDIADGQGGLVLDTRDMSDLALDTREDGCARAAHFSATGGIPKTLARAMIQYAAKLTADSGLRDVLRDVVETPLDAERMPDGGGGALGPFELHDFFLYYTMRWGFPPDKLLRMAAHAFGGKYPAAELESVLSVFLSRFGHSPGPMCGTARVDSVWASGSRLMAGCLPPEDGA